MNRIRLYRTEAIILKRRNYGEADRILTLFTPGRGKVGAIAKGARKLTSRSGGHVELFTRCSVLLAQGRTLDVVTQVDTVAVYRGLREELERMTYAYHAAELVDRLTADGQANAPLFHHLADTLAALSEGDDAALCLRWFEVQLLNLLGYRPQLHQCVECGDELQPDGNVYSPERGGVLCPDCRAEDPRAHALGDGAFRVLRFLQSRPWELARRLELSAASHRTLELCLVDTLRTILERDLRSVEFLDNLRRVSKAPTPGLGA